VHGITAPNALWFRPILRCFKLDFFGEALQRSEIYLLKCTRWLSRVAGHPILERAWQPSKAMSWQVLRVATAVSGRLDLLNDSQFSHGGDASQKVRRVVDLHGRRY
jgi:hypothetical protein